MSPEVSIIVCTYNRASSLGDFLSRLENHVAASGLPAEFVLVDNNSSDATPDILAGFAAKARVPARIIRESRPGANHARNTGIQHAKAPLLVFTDDDVDFSDTWLADLVGHMRRHPACQVVTGKIEPRFLAPRPAWLTDGMLGFYGRQDLGNRPVELEFPVFPVEMNMAIRAAVFQRHGYFSTAMGRDHKSLMSNDGKLFFYKLANSRETITYIPGASLFHLIPSSRITPEWIIRRYFWQGISDVVFQNLTQPGIHLRNIRMAIAEIIKLSNQLRGGHLSPRKIFWNIHGLPVESRAWQAYRWGTALRRLGLK